MTTIVFLLSSLLVGAFASNSTFDAWSITSAPKNNWKSIASSGNGQYVIATSSQIGDVALYQSLDYGFSWTNVPVNGDAPYPWIAVAAAKEANVFYALQETKGLFVSTSIGTPTTGGFWTNLVIDKYLTEPPKCVDVATSATGQVVVVAVSGGGIYFSQSYGNDFIKGLDLPASEWVAVSVSGTGRYVVAVTTLSMYVSSDNGYHWVPAPYGPKNVVWTDVSFATSYASNPVVFATCSGNNGDIYRSDNGGQGPWSRCTAVNNPIGFRTVVINGDGSRAAVVMEGEFVYTSNDGKSFGKFTPAQLVYPDKYSVLAMDATGEHLLAGTSGKAADGTIYMTVADKK